jgi:hypothetical protein
MVEKIGTEKNVGFRSLRISMDFLKNSLGLSDNCIIYSIFRDTEDLNEGTFRTVIASTDLPPTQKEGNIWPEMTQIEFESLQEEDELKTQE